MDIDKFGPRPLILPAQPDPTAPTTVETPAAPQVGTTFSAGEALDRAAMERLIGRPDTAGGTTGIGLGEAVRLETALLGPPPGGYPNLDVIRGELERTIEGFARIADPGRQAELKTELAAVVAAIGQAEPIPLVPGQPGEAARSLTPEAALYNTNLILREIAGATLEPGPLSRPPTAFEAKLGADPTRLTPLPFHAEQAARTYLDSLAGPNSPFAGLGDALPTSQDLLGPARLGYQPIVDPALAEAQALELLRRLESQGVIPPGTAGPIEGIGPIGQPVGGIGQAATDLPIRPLEGPGAATGVESPTTPTVKDPSTKMSPDEVEKRRAEIDKAVKGGSGKGNKDKIANLAKDPKMMAAATPEQKAELIKTTQKGGSKNKHDQAVTDVLKSASSKQEFDKIIDSAGGKKVLEGIGYGEAKEKANILAGMWGRTDVATDPEKARLAEGELLKPQSELFKAGDPSKVDPKFGSRPGAGADAASQFEAASEQNVKNKAYLDIDPSTRAELMMENAKRRKDGKPLLDLTNLTAEMEKIREDTSLSKKDREKKIEDLRKKMGLSEDTMRELGTQRLGQVYSDGAAEAGAMANQMIVKLEAQYREVAAREGEDSPEAQRLAGEIGKLKSKAGEYTKRLDEVGSHLRELYPVPPGFWESFGKWFAKIFDFLSPLLNLIPGVGSFLYAGYQAVKLGIAIANGDVGGIFGAAAGMLGGVGGGLSGIVQTASKAGQAVTGALKTAETAGKVLTTTSKVINGGLAAYQGIDAARRGDIAGFIGGIGGAASAGAGAFGASADTLKTIDRGFSIAKGGASFAQGLASGNFDQALGGLTGVVGGVRELGGAGVLDPNSAGGRILNYVDQGARFATNLANGNVAGAFGQVAQGFGDPTVQGWMKDVANDPTVKGIVDWTNRGIQFTDNVMNGRYAAALGGVVDGLGAADPSIRQALENPTVRDVLTYSQAGLTFTESLRDGRYGEALGVVGQHLQPFLGGQPFKDAVGYVRDLAGVTEALGNRDYLALQRHLVNGVGGAGPLLGALGAGDLSRTLEGALHQGREFLGNPAVKSALDLVGQGAPFVQSLVTGRYEQALAQSLEMPALRGLHPQLDQALGAAREAAPFVRAMASGDYLGGVGLLADPNGPLGGIPAVSNALPMLEQGTSLFSGLAGGFYDTTGARGLAGAVTQLERFEPMRDDLMAFERRVGEVVARAGGDIDRAARLLWQVGSPF